MREPKQIQEAESIDPKEIWEEIRRAASRAPDWASLEAPYPVKASYLPGKEATTGSKTEPKK